MPEIFQTQFEGKTVKRKFCNIPVEKIIEFQNLLGFLPEEFLTFDGGSTYKICVQYAATKDAIEKSYEGTVYYLPEEPANLIIGVNENGDGGTVSKYPRFFEIGEGYLEPYGFILDVSLTRYSEDFSSYVYMINERYDYSLDKRVYDARFIRKICEGYFWSYSLDTSDLNFNIKLHQAQEQNRVSYKPVNLKIIGNLIDLPEDLLDLHTGTNTINLYECWNVLFKRELIYGKENYVAIGEKIISEDILKTFFSIYKNYINPGFRNSFPYYSCGQNGQFYKLNSVDSFYQLHKINDKYFLTHYDFNDNTLTFNNQLQQLRDNLSLKEQESQNLINNFYFNNRNDAYSLLNENQTIDYLITFNFAKNLLNGMTGLDAKYVRSVSLSVMKFLNETQNLLRAYDSSYWTNLYNYNQQNLIQLQNMISTGLNGFGDPLSQNEITEINRLISVSPQISEIYNTLSILNNTLLTYAFTPQSDSAYYMLLDFQNYVCQNPNIMSINPTYVNLLTQFGLPEENITETRITHINHLINVYKEKLIQLKQLTINPIFLQRINPATNQSYTLDLNQNLQILLNDALNLNIIGVLKDIVDLENQIYLLELNEMQQSENEIICKDFIVLKNLLKNSKLSIDQNVLNELSLDYLNLNFNNDNEAEITPSKLYDLFNYTNRPYDPERDTKYDLYKEVKVNLTLDKCWFYTIPKDIYRSAEILFKFFDKASVARFFDHNRKKTQNLNDKIEIIATPKVDFKEVSWSILISDQSEILSSFYESDTLKWEKVRFVNLDNIEISAVKLPLLQAGLNNEAWYIPGNDLMSLFCIEPKAGITLEYDPLERILVHKESTTNSVQNSGIILTRLFSNLDYSPELYVMCSATRNNIFEVSYTKISLEES